MLRKLLLIFIAFFILSCDTSEFAKVDGPEDPIYTCMNEEVRACDTGLLGQCSSGLETCIDHEWGPCTILISPTEELCDGRDNDCDGTIDDVQPIECSSVCGSGFQYCQNGQLTECNAPTPRLETCNGNDDDCDGTIDNMPSRTCNRGCEDGEEYCSNGIWTGCTARLPTPESCDGIDNDCDGITDQDIAEPCEVSCGAAFSECSNGEWLDCIHYTSEEVCDNEDNDCDGEIDEYCGTDIVFLVDRSDSMCVGNTIHIAHHLIEQVVNECTSHQYSLFHFAHRNYVYEPQQMIPLVRSTTFLESLDFLNNPNCFGWKELSVDFATQLFNEQINPGFTSETKLVVIISDERAQYTTQSIREELEDLITDPNNILVVVARPNFSSDWRELGVNHLFNIEELAGSTTYSQICDLLE